MTLDFDGVTDAGHSFADELLRVFPAGQPDVEIKAVRVAPGMAAMLDGVFPVSSPRPWVDGPLK